MLTPFLLNTGMHPQTLLTASLPALEDVPAADYHLRNRYEAQ